jgi:LemA protein
MSKGLIIGLGVFAVLALIIFSWGSGAFNSAVGYQESVNQAFGDVQAAYQRRADLIPNLVATVKAAAENEKAILTQVTQARAGIVGAKTPEDLELAGRKINTAINLAFEAYPQIRSTENFQDLQAQLEGTENRINVARQRYNEEVRKYNTHIRGFTTRFALALFGGGEDFSRKTEFAAAAGSENAPTVDFNK